MLDVGLFGRLGLTPSGAVPVPILPCLQSVSLQRSVTLFIIGCYVSLQQHGTML